MGNYIIQNMIKHANIEKFSKILNNDNTYYFGEKKLN